MSFLNNILDKLTAYLQLKGEKLKLDIIAVVSKLLAHFVAFLVAGVIAFFIFTFGSIALGAFLNEVLESEYLGYLILTGIYIILFIVVILLLRTNKVQNALENFFMELSDGINLEEETDEEETL